jgi:uncharacterized lipoprotein YbaY
MLRIGFSIILLTAWVAAAPAWRSTADEQLAKLTIKGSLTYDTSLTLPTDSRAVVELRHLPALPSAPPVATKPIDLQGKEPPVTFEFDVDRFRLVAGGTYVVRGVVLSGTRVIWASDDVKIDTSASTADAGAVTLTPVKAGGR